MALFICGPKGKWIIGDNCEIKPDKSQKFPKFQRAPGCTSVCVLFIGTANTKLFFDKFFAQFLSLRIIH